MPEESGSWSPLRPSSLPLYFSWLWTSLVSTWNPFIPKMICEMTVSIPEVGSLHHFLRHLLWVSFQRLHVSANLLYGRSQSVPWLARFPSGTGRPTITIFCERKVEKVFFSPVGGQHRFVNIPRDLVMPSWLHRSLAFHLHDWGDHDCLVHISSRP